MYNPITYSLLIEKNACIEQLDLFKKHFGKVKAIPLTKEVAAKFGSHFDINWAASRLLTYGDLTEYFKVNDTAFSEYDKVTHTAMEKFLEVKDNDAEEYSEIIASAYAEYKKTIAYAFVEIYKKGMK